MKREPTAPIFVWEPGDLAAFDFRSDAESYLEAVDVKAGSYKAYDRDGRLLTLGTRTESFSILGFKQTRELVVIDCAEDVPAHREELREILIRFLERVGRDKAWLESLSWDELMDVARDEAVVE